MFLVVNKLLDNTLINYSYTACSARSYTSWILAWEPSLAWKPHFPYFIPALNLISVNQVENIVLPCSPLIV